MEEKYITFKKSRYTSIVSLIKELEELKIKNYKIDEDENFFIIKIPKNKE